MIGPLRPTADCAYAIVSLGEVMLRLDPGPGRIRTARSFQVWEGGGEYNVARGLRRCFGHRAAVVTALADNETGRLVEDLILQGGVSTSHIVWRPYDGVGRRARNGLNFVERGFGRRGAVGVADRGHTATSLLTPEDVDWDHLFGDLGVRWFHTGGVFAGLSDTTPGVAEAAMAAARRHGTIVSYDTNYRPSLWADRAGPAGARAVNRRLAPHADVVFGATAEAFFDPADALPGSGADFASLAGALAGEFGVAVVAATQRAITSASVNDWTAQGWSAATGLLQGMRLAGVEVFDRVGAGDAFAAGLIHGLITTGDLRRALDYGIAHGALTMTTPGDNSMATRPEVEALIAGQDAGVRR